MKLSPMFLTAATTWLGRSSGQYLGLKAQGSHRVELSTEFFFVPEIPERASVASVASVVSVPAPNRTISIFRGYPGKPGYSGDTRTPIIPHNGQTLLRQQPWALPLAALSAATMLLMAGFEIFVLLKARAAAPSRRHLFLGQALLLGLFLLAGLSAAPSLTPNPLSCAALRLVGLPAALIFAALLVKCVFLLSLNSGVYLPAPYQALVLAFAVFVQVAIIGQWFYGEPPSLATGNGQLNSPMSVISAAGSSSTPQCKTPIGHTIASLGYVVLLLLAVACLAVRARGVRDNFREAAFIGLAVGASLPVWVAGVIGALVASEAHREAWLAFSLLVTSLLVFLVMFLPKGRQLAALGRETAIRDREERLSSLPASGYSPSFYHYKPPHATLKRKIHYQSPDRVALVSSEMPGCSACQRGSSPTYAEDIHGPVETFVLPPGMYLRPEEAGDLYTTLSANPNVFFQRAHPGMMY